MKVTDTFVVKKNISLHQVSEDTYVLTDYENGDVYEINGTTVMIWQGLNKGLSPREITLQIKKSALNDDEILEEDILNIVFFLLENALIDKC